MIEKKRGAWAEINLNALRNNIKQVVDSCPGKEIIAVIKADGYGHGALGIYKELQNCGATMFAVATLPEAIELRKDGVKLPIIILGYTSPEFYEEVVKYDIEQTIYSYEAAYNLSVKAVKLNKTAKIHIAVDTGMGRIGFLTTRKEAEEVHKIKNLPNIELAGIFTHFATADEKNKEYTNMQIKRFNEFNKHLEELGINIPLKHVSNSAAIIDLPNLEYNGVRAGIMLYGYYPSYDVDNKRIKLMPVMTLKARIIHIKTLDKGESVSYGRKYITTKETKIGTLPIGYADGLSRLHIGKAKVIVGGKIAPIIGRICMDQCMIDLSEIPDISVGDEVILIGQDEFGNKITADDMADNIGTISYEILCDVSKRIPRVYIKDEKQVEVRIYV